MATDPSILKTPNLTKLDAQAAVRFVQPAPFTVISQLQPINATPAQPISHPISTSQLVEALTPLPISAQVKLPLPIDVVTPLPIEGKTPISISKLRDVVPLKDPVLNVPIEDVRLVNPDLAVLISEVGVPPTDGVPREQIAVPICPQEDVTDEVLFEAATDTTKKFYLPRYRIAEQNQQYQISFEPSGQGWKLVVQLEQYPALSLAKAARNAQEIPHAVSVILKHRLAIGGSSEAQKELPFQEVQPQERGLRTVLYVNSLPELDQLYQAMTDSQYGATLIIRRAVRVGIPVTTPGIPAGYQEQSSYTGDCRNRPQGSVCIGYDDGYIWLVKDTVTGWEERGTWEGKKIVTVLGYNADYSHILGTNFVRQEVKFRPSNAQVASPNVAKAIDSIAANTSTLLFREVTRTLDNTLPFVFPPNLHGYIFRNITKVPNQNLGLVRRQVTWDGSFRSYYQDQAQPYVFYFTPDSFKIVRRRETPHLPLMSVQFVSADGSLDNMQAKLEYVAVPFVSSKRLKAAAQELKQHIKNPLPPGISGPVFEPLLADAVAFRLSLPQANGAARVVDRTKEALIDLRSGIHDSLLLSLQDFQDIFNAMSGGSSVLIQGQVEVDLGDGPNELIPFTTRMNDLAGEIFYYEQFPDELSGGLKVRFQNAIESPVRIDRLPCELRRGQTAVAGQIQKISTLNGDQFPLQLKPNDDVRLLIVPATPLAGNEPLEARFDLDGVAVLPDSEAFWNAILNPNTPMQYSKRIQVKTFKEMFDDPSGKPEQQIRAIVIQFERGNTIELNPGQLEVQATIRLPLSDYILRRDEQGSYRYKVTVVRTQGRSQDADWRTDSTDILYPDIPIVQSDKVPPVVKPPIDVDRKPPIDIGRKVPPNGETPPIINRPPMEMS